MSARLHSLFFILSLFSLLTTTTALTTVPTFQVSNKYCQSGSFSLNVSPFHGNTSSDAIEVFTYSIPLIISHTSYKAVSSISNLNFLFTAQKEVNISSYICGHGTTSLSMCLVSMRTSGLAMLGIRYLLLDFPYASKMTHFYPRAYYYVNNSMTTSFESTTPIITGFNLSPPLNSVGTLKAIAAINGLNVSASDTTLTIDIKIVSSYHSTTVFRIDVTSATTKVLNVGAIWFCLIGFNVQDAMAWPFPAARITSATFLTSTPFTDTGSLFKTYNTFWGITYIRTANQPALSFSSSLAQNTMMNGTSTFANSEWIGVVYEMKQCDSTTPYYMTSQDKCYDICPNLYYEDNVNFLCKTCTVYDCLKCVSNGTCTACDIATRTLNSSTGRCDPLTGFYNTGLLNALPCNSNCLNCSVASTNCTSCNTAQYLNNNACSPCISNCDICTNGTMCGTCASNYVTDSSNLCVLAFNCSLATNCASCTPATGCMQCSPGYSNLTQSSCNSVCGDGFLSPTQQCDVGNNITADGCVNCTKKVGHFCTGTIGSLSFCTECSTNCISCINLTSCQQCNLHFILNTNSSVCEANCSQVNHCLTCNVVSNAVQCSTCMNGYNLSASKQCIIICGVGQTLVNGNCQQTITSSPPQPSSPSQLSSPPQPSGGINLLYILLPLLLGLLLCCCCLVIFCIWRRRKNEENKVQEENEGQIQNIDQNNTKLEENVKFQTLNESKDVFDQKTLNKKKTKYRGDPNKSVVKPKKSRAALREQTEENVISLQEFKDTLQLKKSQNNNNKGKSTEKGGDEHLHIVPIMQTDNAQQLQVESHIQKLQQEITQNVQTVIQRQKSQIQNEDINRNRMRDDFSQSNQTKQQEQQKQSRGR